MIRACCCLMSKHEVSSSTLTTPSRTEPVLAVCKDLVRVKVLQNIVCYGMFLDLAADAFKGQVCSCWLCTCLSS